MNQELILDNGSKIFQIKDKKIYALNNISIIIEKGKFYAIMGHSGAGKSTLMQIMGLLDSLSSGNLYINGMNTKNISDNERAKIRMEQIGFIFQSFYLNKRLKAIENVVLPMYINPNINKKERNYRAKELLKKFRTRK